MAPHVVIVGGGFGGLYAARALRSAAVNVLAGSAIAGNPVLWANFILLGNPD